MIVSASSLFGTKFSWGLDKVPTGAPPKISSKSEFKLNEIKSSGTNRSLLANPAAVNEIKQTSTGGANFSAGGITHKKESVALNFSKTKVFGESETMTKTLESYAAAKDASSVSFDINYVNAKGENTKGSIKFDAGGITLPNGKKIALTSDSAADALKKGGFGFSATIDVSVTKVDAHTVTDESGAQHTQEGFLLYKINFKGEGLNLEGSFVAANTEAPTVALADTSGEVIEHAFSVGSTKDLTKTEFEMPLNLLAVEDIDLAQIQAEARKNKQFLTMVYSASSASQAAQNHSIQA